MTPQKDSEVELPKIVTFQKVSHINSSRNSFFFFVRGNEEDRITEMSESMTLKA